MSSEEPDLPVAAKVTAVGGMADDGAAIQNFVQISEGDEFVRKSDAEDAIEKTRRSERQKILDKIKDKREKFNNGRSNEYPQTVLTELLQKIRRSRQHES